MADRVSLDEDLKNLKSVKALVAELARLVGPTNSALASTATAFLPDATDDMAVGLKKTDDQLVEWVTAVCAALDAVSKVQADKIRAIFERLSTADEDAKSLVSGNTTTVTVH